MAERWAEEEKSEAYIKDEIYKTLKNLYHGIVKVDLNTGYAFVLCSSEQEETGKQYPWEEYLERYVNRYILPSDRLRAVKNFSVRELQKRLDVGRKTYSCDLASYVVGKNEKHVMMVAFSPDDYDGQYVYVLVRNDEGDYLLNAIVNQYVYDTCDYFIYLDARNNSYTMFSGHPGTPLPPEICTDYEKAVVEYAQTFVVEEDREMVMREMHLPRVLEEIEKNKIHSFTCGIIENEGKYARKRLDYRYHDKENQMILLSRTDITDIYLEEEKKRSELEKALVRAQTDPLTKLLNFQATVDRITECLEKAEKQYALFFIDLDNFKGINDTYGHPVGDSVLRNIAGNLKGIKRNEDIVGRVGGDEFVFFAGVENDRQEVEQIAEKICGAIRSVKISDTTEEGMTGSVGIALSPLHGRDYYTLVTKADKGVYEAKRTGKDKYAF